MCVRHVIFLGGIYVAQLFDTYCVCDDLYFRAVFASYSCSTRTVCDVPYFRAAFTMYSCSIRTVCVCDVSYFMAVSTVLLLWIARLINSRGVSRFRSAQSITILLPVWSASKDSRKGGGCHEANNHSRGNGCALSGRFCSCTDQGFGCDPCAVVPE